MAGWAAAAQAATSLAESWWNNDQAMERQDDAQTYGWQTMDQQLRNDQQMRSTAFQTQVQDLEKAGLNPMLGYTHGSSGAPTLQASPTTGGIASPGGNRIDFASAYEGFKRAELADAQIDKTHAEADEVRARTPTHAVNIQSTLQSIDESKARIDKIIQDTKTSEQSAAESAQRVINLQEEVPKLRANVKQIEALTRLTAAQLKLTEAQKQHLDQQINENLPKLKAALDRLEIQSQTYGMNKKGNDAIAHSAALGQIGSILRSLLPFGKE